MPSGQAFTPESDPRQFPWDQIDDPSPTQFGSADWTLRILEGLSVYRPGTTDVDPARAAKVIEVLSQYSGRAISRLRALAKTLNEMFVDKEEIIKMVVVSAIAHQPMLLVGKPGTAKSKIVLKFCEGLGLRKVAGGRRQVFQYLLHAFTEPDEILGPVNIELLRQHPPRFERLREGSITDAEVLFMDEVFRANSAILNALLSVINERQVYEGGVTQAARARLVYGASNSTPSARLLDDLRAFYERFIIRVESDCIAAEFDPQTGGAPANRRKLLQEGWKNEVRELRAGYRPEASAMSPQACLNHVLLLNRAIAELWGGSDLRDEAFQADYHKLVSVLSGGPDPVVEIDDRKFIRLMAVLRAHSIFMHEGPPQRDDLIVLRHVWHDLDSKHAVQIAVDNWLKSPSA